MPSVNILEAKTRLSKLVSQIENGQEREVIISRNGRPVARLVPLPSAGATDKRIGLLKGRFKAPSLEVLDAHNAEVERLFHGAP